LKNASTQVVFESFREKSTKTRIETFPSLFHQFVHSVVLEKNPPKQGLKHFTKINFTNFLTKF